MTSPMKIAISGSHGTGKSTLIAAFLERFPEHASEPEAFEVLADEITIVPSEGPDGEGLVALLEFTLSVLEDRPADASVVFERCPVDYLAYAVASRSLADSERSELLDTWIPAVRAAVRSLDLVALLPVSPSIPARPGEDEDFRERVDEAMRGALIDDEYGLFEDSDAPRVVELPLDPDRRLDALARWLQ